MTSLRQRVELDQKVINFFLSIAPRLILIKNDTGSGRSLSGSRACFNPGQSLIPVGRALILEEKIMKKLSVKFLTTLILAFVSMTAFAQSENPFIGSWDIDFDESDFGSAAPPPNISRAYADLGDGNFMYQVFHWQEPAVLQRHVCCPWCDVPHTHTKSPMVVVHAFATLAL